MKQIQKGFTLVEMIMAIMLMSMIALIIGVIFNTMFSSRELIEREATMFGIRRNKIGMLLN